MFTIFVQNGLPISGSPQAGYLLKSRTILASSGSSVSGTYTPPSLTRALLVEGVSGGGGASNVANSTAGNAAAGCGGVGGGFCSSFFGHAQGDTYAYTVGGGGTGSGGTGLQTLLTNNRTGNQVFVTSAGADGTSLASGNTEVFTAGSNGISGAASADLIVANNRNVPVHRTSGSVIRNGRGGGSRYGGRPLSRVTQGTGASGGNYGAAGSGGVSINAGGAANGGTGAGGLLVIWEFS